MPLDTTKLEKVVDLADGMMRARCPACAEQGQDKKGEHLRIYPDGRFGCCVHQGDREHRKRVYALAGERSRQGIKVRVAAAKTAGAVQSGIFGRLGRVFGVPAAAYSNIGEPDGPDGGGEAGTRSDESRTGRTGESQSNGEGEQAADGDRTGRTGQSESSGELFDYSRTLRTPGYSSNTALNELPRSESEHVKGFPGGVRTVRQAEAASEPPPEPEKGGAEQPAANESGERMPYLTPGGTLGIPFNAPARYLWWMPDGERMSVKEIHAEVLEREKMRKASDANGV